MRIVLAFLLVQTLQAAVVQGVVLDHDLGAPLARTLVELIPVEGTRAKPVLLRTAERGTFAISNVAPGWYVVRGSRKAYIAGEVGQSRIGRPGRPFQVERNDQSFFVELRLTHTGALSGIVVDENNVGIPDWDVHVFTAQRPITRITQGKTDDRGNFRLWGLDAGTYFVRSAEGDLEDGTTLLPAYHKFGTELRYAEPVPVKFGETTPDLRIQPPKGKLFTIRGKAPGCSRLTMITDSSRRVVEANTFQIERVPPGPVDLLGEGPGAGGVLHLNVDRDLYGQFVPCNYLNPLQTNLTRSSTNQDSGKLMMRRLDLDGPGEWKAFQRRDIVVPGTYEATVLPDNPGRYVSTLGTEFRPGKQQADGSFLIEVSSNPAIMAGFRQAALIEGTVIGEGKPAIGAPVYIEMFDPTLPFNEQRLHFWSIRTDVGGKFTFPSLPPAQYRLLSSFDFDSEDRYAMNKGSTVTLKAGDSVVQDLKMLP